MAKFTDLINQLSTAIDEVEKKKAERDKAEAAFSKASKEHDDAVTNAIALRMQLDELLNATMSMSGGGRVR